MFCHIGRLNGNNDDTTKQVTITALDCFRHCSGNPTTRKCVLMWS